MPAFRGVIASMCPRDRTHGRELLDRCPGGIAAVELRADRLSQADTNDLLDRVGGPAILTIRSVADGGYFRGSESDRQARLQAAFDRQDVWVDVEWGEASDALCRGDRDARTILSRHGGSTTPASWSDDLIGMTATGAARIKRVVRLRQTADLLAIHELQKEFGDHGRVTIFAEGSEGASSRLQTLATGGWGTYTALSGDLPTAPGQFAAEVMLTALQAPGPIAVLLGASVGTSPSPAMHQAALHARKAAGAYLAFSTPTFDSGRQLAEELFGESLRGLAVTVPFKTAAAGFARAGDRIVERCGAANTLRREPSGWVAFNTDGPAILERLYAHGLGSSETILILGAGGTARAAAVACIAAGHPVRMAVRDAAARRSSLERIGAVVVDWEERTAVRWGGLVQATPLGPGGETVLAPESLCGGVVLDAVYGPQGTALGDAARRAGCRTIDGLELLAAQGILQHKILFGIKPAWDPFLRSVRGYFAANDGSTT